MTLIRSIYSLIQAVHCWFKEYTKTMNLKVGFKQWNTYTCILYRVNEIGTIIFIVYIDDTLATCSATFCDKLLVEANIFYHFRGLILCNVKHLQFNWRKKQGTSCTVQKVFYSNTLYFFKFNGVIGSVCVCTIFLSLRRLNFNFWWLLVWNIL